MKEDGQKNYAGNITQNLNIMRKVALGLLANEKIEAMSKNRKMKKALLTHRVDIDNFNSINY